MQRVTRHSRIPLRRAATLAVAVALGLAACSSGGAKSAKRKPAPTTTTTAPPIAPLTGLADPTGVAQGRAALNVKIENLPVARPQAGLDLADVVYEEIVNGGITRFVAVFQSTSPDPIGPVRSVRPMDPAIVQPLGGLFVYSGGIPEEIARIQATPGLITLDETQAGAALFRDRRRQAPHNLYGHPDKLWAKGGKPVPPAPLFTYLKQGESFPGDAVTAFTMPFDKTYGQPTYTWNPASKAWARSYGASPHVMADGAQIAPTNVIVQFVQYQPQPGVDGGTILLTGEGDAWVFSDGKVVKGRWVRPDVAQAARFVDATGKPIAITPGRTWVELAPVAYQIPVVTPPPAPPSSTSTP